MKKLILSFVLLTGLQVQAKALDCVNVYFDRSTDPTYWMGKTYTTLLQNLLGHFPEYQQIISPIELYEQGEIDKCAATIYIGSYFNNPIPAAFLDDYANTKKNVAWIGYNIWQLGDRFEKAMGYSYSHLSTMNKEKLDPRGRPSFLKNILYKGEVFFKYGEWSQNTQGLFVAPFEQAVLVPTEGNKTEVLAWAQNPVTNEKAPYILRAKNHFYVADVPLSFMHEADRYLVFADVLFDILNAKPKHNGQYAFLRIEDVHALVPLSWLYRTNQVLKEEKVPINISLVPIFFDPLNQYTRGPYEEVVTMDRHRSFMSWIEDTKKDNGSFIWHGVTHQHKRMANPHSGVSGDDFEFFDAVTNMPIAEDSPQFVLNKLEDGFEILQRAGVTPRIWLMPHYQASALDYVIFGEVFSWNVGRAIYYNHSVKGMQKDLLKKDAATGDDKRLWFESRDPQSKALRMQVFKNLTVKYESMVWSGQMFPYEIYGDVHGQRLIPENLGNSQPFVNEHVTSPRTKEDIISDAKRNRVLRDVWASFFYHPFLLTSYEEGGRGAYPGDPSELRFIIQGLKDLGYQFIDINKFMDKNTKVKRPEPIYKEQTL
ncbi:DUF2334 domain-containing protein [Bdellovibrio bacteriovorus]|uniref:DUF2334 domain-containing protein n=1 Tax=Bdellovibrio bacteriovorus TaxID=959 RepID=UPI0035A70D27